MSSNMKTYTEELKLTSEDIDTINRDLNDKNFIKLLAECPHFYKWG